MGYSLSILHHMEGSLVSRTHQGKSSPLPLLLPAACPHPHLEAQSQVVLDKECLVNILNGYS